MMRTVATLFALLALSSCGPLNAQDEQYVESIHKTISVNGVKTLRLENTAGTVRIDATAGSDVVIDAVKKGRTAESVGAIHVNIASAGGTISIESRYEVSPAHENVDYSIKAPASLALEVSNMAGTMHLDGFSRDVSARAQAGTIAVAMAKLGGDQKIDLRSTAGTIALTIPRKSDARVDARSTVGTFHSDFEGVEASREMLVGSHGSGTIGNGSAKVTLSATTGTIDLSAH
jgi:DUF4097 and DUF4098 domain-containing protein YvlB